jgi:hypothetical protein
MAMQTVPEIPFGFKTCKVCQIEKPLAEFDYEPRVRTKTTAKCSKCVREYQKKWATDHPDRVKASRKKHAEKYPERILEMRNFNERRRALEVRERRITEGKPLPEPRVTEDGRRCSKCRRRKPSEEFPPNASMRDGLNCYCRECTNRVAREQSKKPPVRLYRQRYMRSLALKKYGITIEDFDRMVLNQDGKCAICLETLKFGTGGCAVDHDHLTKKIRGLLCRLCNVGVGHFRENENLFLRAIEYLKQ